MAEEPGCGWCADTGRDPAFPDALCPEPDCAAANRERVNARLAEVRTSMFAVSYGSNTTAAKVAAATVAEWLAEQAADVDAAAQAEPDDRRATAYQVMADALGVAAERAREGV